MVGSINNIPVQGFGQAKVFPKPYTLYPNPSKNPNHICQTVGKTTKLKEGKRLKLKHELNSNQIERSNHRPWELEPVALPFEPLWIRCKHRRCTANHFKSRCLMTFKDTAKDGTDNRRHLKIDVLHTRPTASDKV